mgnify:CR=1 FL=1
MSPEKRGTFEGVIERFPILKSSGITTLEMMPPVMVHIAPYDEKCGVIGAIKSK